MSDNKTEIYQDWEDAKFTMPENKVKKKVGSGGVPDVILQRAEVVMEENHHIDFNPFADKYLSNIEKSLSQLTKDNYKSPQSMRILAENIMHLKANGGMFGYMLVSYIADIALNFSDNQKIINEDFVKIIKAHNTTIRLIIGNKLKGDGGNSGNALKEELYNAIMRFNKKHRK